MDPEDVNICKIVWGIVFLPWGLWCRFCDLLPGSPKKYTPSFRADLSLIGLYVLVDLILAYGIFYLLSIGLWYVAIVAGIVEVGIVFLTLIGLSDMGKYTISETSTPRQKFTYFVTTDVAEKSENIIDLMLSPLGVLEQSQTIEGIGDIIGNFLYSLKQRTCYLLKITD